MVDLGYWSFDEQDRVLGIIGLYSTYIRRFFPEDFLERIFFELDRVVRGRCARSACGYARCQWSVAVTA